MYEIAGRLVLREGVPKLLRDPAGRRMGGDGHMDNPPPLVRITSTNRSRNVTVGTTNRSVATIWLAWFVRNVRHVCDGGRECRRMYFATVDWLTTMPSFCNSP
jgi:hypothetical protein